MVMLLRLLTVEKIGFGLKMAITVKTIAHCLPTVRHLKLSFQQKLSLWMKMVYILIYIIMFGEQISQCGMMKMQDSGSF